jgi:hypothetical protein
MCSHGKIQRMTGKLCNEERPMLYSLCLRRTDSYSGKALILYSRGGGFESRPGTSAILIAEFNSFPLLANLMNILTITHGVGLPVFSLFPIHHSFYNVFCSGEIWQAWKTVKWIQHLDGKPEGK